MTFKVVVITPEKNHPKEIEIICSLFQNGLKSLHVRKPGFTKQDLTNYLSLIPKKYHSKISIHSHYSLLNHFVLGGIHLREAVRKNKLPKSFNSKKHSLSASFHSITDINRSRRKWDYIFLSPIYNSISKKGYAGNFEINDLIYFLKQSKKPVVALGGVSSKNILEVKKSGFVGAAVLGSVWESKNLVQSFCQLQLKIK